jgi:uncharacterized membrane protein (TIGR02234 family)
VTPQPAAGRRELAVAVLTAAGRAWVSARAVQGPLQVPLVVRGGASVPEAPALAVVGLAGALALLATRGVVRAATGLIIAGCGIGAAVAAANGARPGAGALADRAGAALGTGSAQVQDVATNGWPVVAVAGALLFACGGALAMARGRRWPGMSARYDAPHRGPATAAAGGQGGRGAPEPNRAGPDDALEQWRALDRGEDPTI